MVVNGELHALPHQICGFLLFRHGAAALADARIQPQSPPFPPSLQVSALDPSTRPLRPSSLLAAMCRLTTWTSPVSCGRLEPMFACGRPLSLGRLSSAAGIGLEVADVHRSPIFAFETLSDASGLSFASFRRPDAVRRASNASAVAA